MEQLPIFLAVRGKWAVVIGGGLAAARRAELLLRAGAQVTVFAPAFSEEFAPVAETFAFERIARWPHRAAELEGVSVCVIATDEPAQDERAHVIAKEARALVNVATRPDLCDFTLPSIVDRSPLLVAISTGGASPAPTSAPATSGTSTTCSSTSAATLPPTSPPRTPASPAW